MANFDDPNMFKLLDSGKSINFESWALDTVDLNNPDFNLFNFIGADEEANDNIEYGSAEQDSKQNSEDKLYTTLKYNEMMFNDFSNDKLYTTLKYNEMMFNDFSNEFHNGQYEGYENQNPGDYIDTSADNHDILNNCVSYLPTTSKSSIPMPLKAETGYEYVETTGEMAFDDSGAYSDSESYAHSIGSFGTYQDGVFKPKTKPRKYQIKPVEEKQNPVYKIKREKNNDAVRRSRDKAKQIQLEKEERLTFLDQETVKQDRIIQQQRATIAKLQQKVDMMTRQCSWNSVLNLGLCHADLLSPHLPVV
uniref:BZIP domain-containing protein n=1 Tax=Acrobeloides nanus TaxID=290746 RepID=A0A914EM46_9BILA